MIKAPTIKELKERPCTLEEVQAALVKLIELHNKQGKAMEEAVNRKQDQMWSANI